MRPPPIFFGFFPHYLSRFSNLGWSNYWPVVFYSVNFHFLRCFQNSLTRTCRFHLRVVWFFNARICAGMAWPEKMLASLYYLYMAWNLNIVMYTMLPLPLASTFMNQEVSSFVIKWFLCIVRPVVGPPLLEWKFSGGNYILFRRSEECGSGGDELCFQCRNFVWRLIRFQFQ